MDATADTEQLTRQHDDVIVTFKPGIQSVDNSTDGQTGETETAVLLPVTSTNGLSVSPEFVDEMDRLFSSSDKVYLKRMALPFSEVFSTFKLCSQYEGLNSDGTRLFLMGICVPTRRGGKRVQNFVLSNNVGIGVLTITNTGWMSQDVSGAGLLSFTQNSRLFGGYVVRDPWKVLFYIRRSWVPFCTCCLASNSVSATMGVVNLDGSPTGTISYRRWLNLGFSEPTFSVHFIPNLNPKAKYILFAASLTPLWQFFNESTRGRHTLWLMICYFVICSLLLAGILAIS